MWRPKATLADGITFEIPERYVYKLRTMEARFNLNVFPNYSLLLNEVHTLSSFYLFGEKAEVISWRDSFSTAEKCIKDTT